MDVQPRSKFLAGGVCVALALAAGATMGAARQTAPASPDSITVLLSEVHALRLAMEQSAVITPRIQLTLGRLAVQEQRINRLAGPLERIRRQLADANAEMLKLSGDLEDIERSLPRAQTEEARSSLEYERRTRKQAQATQSAIEHDLKARESDAATQLSAEEARWVELNAHLDELERMLGPVRR